MGGNMQAVFFFRSLFTTKRGEGEVNNRDKVPFTSTIGNTLDLSNCGAFGVSCTSDHGCCHARKPRDFGEECE